MLPRVEDTWREGKGKERGGEEKNIDIRL